MININLQDILCNSPYLIRSITINAYGYLLSRRRFGKDFKKYYDNFLYSQWRSTEEIKELQIDNLKKIINIAYDNVPYYKKLFDKYDLSPKDIEKIEDLKRIPTLNKSLIRENFKMLINSKVSKRNIIKHYSSGTTGQKLEFYLPKELAYGVNFAQLYRFYSWADVRLLDRRVTIGGRIFTYRPPYWIYNKAENQLLLSIHHLNEKTVDDYIRKIKEFNPVFIQGHPTGIYFLANRLLERNESIPLKAVFTTGETLFDVQREMIEKAFKCKVFESYGLGESVISAFECERHNGFHEASELGIIEFERDKSGLYRVIGTSLYNYVMPFIRYEIEDLVEITTNEKCICGRGLPLKIKKIIGRVDDILFSSSGITIFPVTIRMSIKPLLKPFESYQLQQVGKKDFIFLITSKLDKSRRDRILDILKSILGEDIKLEIKEVDNIITKSGKVRTVLNLYKNEDQSLCIEI